MKKVTVYYVHKKSVQYDEKSHKMIKNHSREKSNSISKKVIVQYDEKTHIVQYVEKSDKKKSQYTMCC